MRVAGYEVRLNTELISRAAKVLAFVAGTSGVMYAVGLAVLSFGSVGPPTETNELLWTWMLGGMTLGGGGLTLAVLHAVLDKIVEVEEVRDD